MDITNWCNSGRRTIWSGHCYEKFDSVNSSATKLNKFGWKALWMKFKEKRRKIFQSSAPTRVTYSEYTYLQNFDQGFAWDEPDNLSRSFSVRFADSSRGFLKKGLV